MKSTTISASSQNNDFRRASDWSFAGGDNTELTTIKGRIMKISRRKALVAGASFIAAPALLTRRGYAVEQRSIKIGSVLTGTTMAGELMVKYLKEVAVDVEVRVEGAMEPFSLPQAG
jgi:hypothetical protein